MPKLLLFKGTPPFGLFLSIAGVLSLLQIITDISQMINFYSWAFLSIGILEIIYALLLDKQNTNRKWNIALGIITTSIGLIILTDKTYYMEILSFYIGILLIFRSTISFNLGIEVFNLTRTKGIITIGFSILLFLLGCLLVWRPTALIHSEIYWIGISLLFSGIVNIYIHNAFKEYYSKFAVNYPAKEIVNY